MWNIKLMTVRFVYSSTKSLLCVTGHYFLLRGWFIVCDSLLFWVLIFFFWFFSSVFQTEMHFHFENESTRLFSFPHWFAWSSLLIIWTHQLTVMHTDLSESKTILNRNSILLQCKRLKEKKREKAKPLWAGRCETLLVSGMARADDKEQPISTQVHGVCSELYFSYHSEACTVNWPHVAQICADSLVMAKSAWDHLMLFRCLWDLWQGQDGEQSMSLSVGDRTLWKWVFPQKWFCQWQKH